MNLRGKKDHFPLVFIAALTVVIIITPGLDWPWRTAIAFAIAAPVALVWSILYDAYIRDKQKRDN